MKTVKTLSLLSILTIGILFMGCSEENTLEPTPSSGLSASSDAAESVAGALGERSGGVMDYVGDIVALSSPLGLSKSTADFVDSREASYDEMTGTWTVILQRQRGTEDELPYGIWDRLFTYQFINEAGEPQMFFITQGDTARSIKFEILEGDGYFANERLSHDLTFIEASLTATDTHTDMVTVNGTYKRAAIDTITTERFTRISDHTLELNIVDLKGPKGSRRDLSQKVSGTVNGTFHADVTFDGERGYAEREINRTIEIVIGSGEADIKVAGETFNSDVENGTLN